MLRTPAAILTGLLLLAGCSSPPPAPSNQPAPKIAADTPASTPDSTPAPTPTPAPEDTGRPEVPAALQRTTTSGFLSDYSKLQPNPIHKGSLIQRSEKLATYKTFMIDAPKVMPTQTVRGEPLAASAAARLGIDLKAAASDALGVNFTVTDRPGEGVARIRLAITQVAECLYKPGTTDQKIGGASVEMEIVDSITGERLAAATESDAVTTRDPDLTNAGPFYDTHLVFQHWAARLAKSLTDAQQ